METTKYAPKLKVDELIDANYTSIFKTNPYIEYIASVPKCLDRPNQNEFYIEIGMSNSSVEYVPIICDDGSCKINTKGLQKNQMSKHLFVNSFKLQSHKKKERPLKYGVNIANQYLGYGTLGGILEIQFNNNKKGKFLISNHHVLCGRVFIKDRFISQPHSNFNDYEYHPKDIIAQVKYGHYNDTIDVAFAKLFDIPHLPENYIKNEDIPIGIEQDNKIKEGESIYKIGAKTGKKFGIIKSKNAYFRFKENETTASNKKILKKQLLLSNISNSGDSGSLVLNAKTKMVIGLLMGGDGENYSVANQFKFIFSKEKLYPKSHLPPMKFIKFI